MDEYLTTGKASPRSKRTEVQCAYEVVGGRQAETGTKKNSPSRASHTGSHTNYLLYKLHRMNEGYRACGELKSVLSNRGLGIKAKKCLYEGVIVPTALYGAEARGMRSVERRKVNVLEMKCLRSLVGGIKRCVGELE